MQYSAVQKKVVQPCLCSEFSKFHWIPFNSFGCELLISPNPPVSCRGETQSSDQSGLSVLSQQSLCWLRWPHVLRSNYFRFIISEVRHSHQSWRWLWLDQCHYSRGWPQVLLLKTGKYLLTQAQDDTNKWKVWACLLVPVFVERGHLNIWICVNFVHLQTKWSGGRGLSLQQSNTLP